MGFEFKPAVKYKAKLRMAFCGVAGSGKTYTALVLATALAGENGKIAVIDSERKSATKYADIFKFDVLDLEPPYTPKSYYTAILEAERLGYDVIVIDSLTHAWQGAGGALEMVDNIATKSNSGNKFAAWRDVTPEHNKLVDSMMQARCHIIATMRSKMEYAMEKNDRDKLEVKKVAMAPIQREGMEYEFDVAVDMDCNHILRVSKTRCSAIADTFSTKPDSVYFKPLIDWLDGTPPPPKELTGTLTPDEIRHSNALIADWVKSYDPDGEKKIKPHEFLKWIVIEKYAKKDSAYLGHDITSSKQLLSAHWAKLSKLIDDALASEEKAAGRMVDITREYLETRGENEQ